MKTGTTSSGQNYRLFGDSSPKSSKFAVECSGRLICERCLKRMREGAVMSVSEASAKLQGLIDRHINSAGFRDGGRGTPRVELYRRCEAPAAMPLPAVLPQYADFYPHLRVSRAYRVKAGGWTFSVPYKYVSRFVSVEISSEEAVVWSDKDGRIIARHALSKAGPDRTVADDAHMPPEHRAIKSRELKYKCADDISSAALELGPQTASLCSGILDRKGFLQGRRGCIAIINRGHREARSGRIAEFEDACQSVRAGDPQTWNSYKVSDALESILQEEASSHDGSFQRQAGLQGDGGREAPARVFTCMINEDKEKNDE